MVKKCPWMHRANDLALFKKLIIVSIIIIVLRALFITWTSIKCRLKRFNNSFRYVILVHCSYLCYIRTICTCTYDKVCCKFKSFACTIIAEVSIIYLFISLVISCIFNQPNVCDIWFSGGITIAKIKYTVNKMLRLIRKEYFKDKTEVEVLEWNMIRLFFLGGLCHLVVSQTLYEPILGKNTLLNDGVKAKFDTLLNTYEKSLQNEHTASIELARNVQNLTSYLETTTIALMAIQQKFNVTDQYCSVCLYLVAVIEYHLIKICFS